MGNTMNTVLTLSFTDRNDAILITDIDPNILEISKPYLRIVGKTVEVYDQDTRLAEGSFRDVDIASLLCAKKIVISTDLSKSKNKSFFVDIQL